MIIRCTACNGLIQHRGRCWNPNCMLAGHIQPSPYYEPEPLSEAKEVESAQASNIRSKEGKVIVADEFESAHDRATAFDVEALRLSEAQPDPNICEDEGCPHYGTPHGHDPASVVTQLPQPANPIVELVDDLVGKAISMRVSRIREVMNVDKTERQLPLRPQHIFAIHRDENNDFCLRLYFDRVPTDEEMRMTQNILNLSFKAAYLKKHHDAAGFPQQPKDSIQ